jgi:hypothetical protein
MRELTLCLLRGRLDAGKFEATGGASLKWRDPRIQMIVSSKVGAVPDAPPI